MDCEDCLTRYHIKCVNMGDNMYQVHMHHNSYTWVCLKCVLPNFTISSLFATFTVSNSFKLLADLPNDGSIIPSVPVSPRGPQCTSSPKKRRNTHEEKKLCKQRSRSNPPKIINLNFQSLRNKILQFQALLEMEKPDFVVGTETFLNHAILTRELMPPTYQVFRRDRQTSTTSGGVLLANHSNLVARDELHLETNCEMIWASVYLMSCPTLYLGASNRPHHGISLLDKQCLNEIDLSISRLKNNCHIILAGDFNLPDVDWSKKFVSPQCRYSTLSNQLINITHNYNLYIVATSPTRKNNILDLVFTNVPFLVLNASILQGLSDYDMVSVEILISPIRIK